MANPQTFTAQPSAFYPLHVILAAYPVACFTGAFLTDIVYVQSYNMQWANFSVWLITAGLVMGALAAAAGIVDYLRHRSRPARGSRWPHMLGTLLVFLLSLWNVFVHSRDAYTSVMPTGLILSGIVSVLVIATSWLGTTLAYAQNREIVR